jgi:hypothetical protein
MFSDPLWIPFLILAAGLAIGIFIWGQCIITHFTKRLNKYRPELLIVQIGQREQLQVAIFHQFRSMARTYVANPGKNILELRPGYKNYSPQAFRALRKFIQML